MPWAPSLVRRVDLVPRDYIYARVRVLPVVAIDLPPRLGAGAIWSCRPWLDDRDAALDAWQRRTFTGKPKWHGNRQRVLNSRFSTWFTKTARCVPIAECRATSLGASMAMPLRVPSSKNRTGSSRRSQGLRPLA